MPTTSITWQNLTNATVNGGGDLEKTTDTLGGSGCMDNASGSGDAGARSVEVITGPDWEFRCTLGPLTGSGRSFVGVDNGSFSLDYTSWQFCFHVSTFNNTSGTPHPPNSIFIYQGAPPNKTYLDGVWNEGDLLRIVCTGSTVRYYLNSLLMYTSSQAPTYPLFACASLACLGGTVEDAAFITSAGNAACEPGIATGDECSGPWSLPTPGPFPVPALGGPIPEVFYEIEGDWGEFGHKYADGVPDFNTIQTAPIRRFVAEYTGLDDAERALLDDHHKSTRGGLKFTLQNPNTLETITGVRYEEYSGPPHQKVWSKNRQIKFIKYTS